MKRSRKKQSQKLRAAAPTPSASPWILAAGFIIVGYGLVTDPGAILSLLGAARPAAWSLRNPAWLKILWLATGLACLLLASAFRPKAAPPRPPLGRLDRAFLFLLATEAALCLLSPHPAASLPLLPILAAALAVYLTLRTVFTGRAAAGATWLAAACFACALASLAIALARPGLWSKEVPLYLVRGVEAARDVAGTFANPNFTASFLLLGALVFICWSGPWGSSRGRLAWYAAGGLTTATLVATLSRAAWLALAAGAAGAWLTAPDRGRRAIRTWASRGLALVIVALTLAALVAPAKFASLGDPRSLGKRKVYWSAAWKAFRDAPVLGHGPGTFPQIWTTRRPSDYRRIGIAPVTRATHNVLLQRLAETGIAGTLAFILLVAVCALPLLRTSSALPASTRGLGWGCLAFLFHNLLSSTLYEPSTALAFIVVLALYGGALDVEKKRTEKGKKNEGRMPHRSLRCGVAFYLLAFALGWGRLCLASHHAHQARLLRRRDIRGATAAARRALSTAPSTLRPRYDLAGTLTLQGHYDEAFAHYLLVESGHAYFDEVLSNRCLASLAAGDPRRCKALSGEALRRDSHNVGLLVAISKADYRLGDLEGALGAARIASKLLPHNKSLAALVSDLGSRLDKAPKKKNSKKIH